MIDGILTRLASGDAGDVWTPADFTELGSRAAVDKALQRLAARGVIRRIDRGLYDQPRRIGSPASRVPRTIDG